MGAMAELRPIIVIGTFMAIVIILIGIIPSQMFGSQSPELSTIPSNTSWSSILATNDTMSYNLTGGDHNFGNKDFGGWHLNLFEMHDGSFKPVLLMQVADAWYFYFYNKEDFLWTLVNQTVISIFVNVYDPIGTWPWQQHNVLKISVLDNLTSGNGTLPIFYLKSSRATIMAYLVYNQTAYAYPSLAYNAGNMVIVLGIDFNERNTQINAWTVIGALLTFQLIPNCDAVISLIIEIPMWLAEIYVVFILVLRVIGAVFGGGGA